MLPKFIQLLLLAAAGTWVGSETDSEAASADVLLDCWYLEESGSTSLRLGAAFSRVKALVVLRNVSVLPESATDPWTAVEPQPGDEETIIFEVDGSGVPIPDGESWLHADCSGEQVGCEVGALPPQEKGRPMFLASLLLPGSGLGLTLILGSQDISGGGKELGRRLGVEVSESGTVPVSVDFLLYTRTPKIQTRLGRPVSAHCAHSGLQGWEFSLEWRVQHQGLGRRVFTLSGGEGRAEREGSHLDVEKALSDGDLSLHLAGVSIGDEGTYICRVSSQRGNAQQTSVVEVVEPPQVRVFTETAGPHPLLVCEASRFYPLPVKISWLLLPPPGAEADPPIPLPVTFNSHRKNRDGTFNLSGEIDPREAAHGETIPLYACRVTHRGLETPITAIVPPETPTEPTQSYSAILGQGIILSIILVLSLVYVRRNHRHPSDASNAPEQEKRTEQ